MKKLSEFLKYLEDARDILLEEEGHLTIVGKKLSEKEDQELFAMEEINGKLLEIFGLSQIFGEEKQQ